MRQSRNSKNQEIRNIGKQTFQKKRKIEDLRIEAVRKQEKQEIKDVGKSRKHKGVGNRESRENRPHENHGFQICGTYLSPENVEIRTTESLSGIRLSMSGCISGRAAIKKKTHAASTTFFLTLAGGFHLMILWPSSILVISF